MEPDGSSVLNHGPRWFLRIVGLAGLAVTTYLAAASLGASPVAGCGAGSSCASVLASRWSRLGSLPVSALAAATYLVALGALLHVGPRATPGRRRVAWFVLLLVAASIALAAVWFVFLQAVTLRKFCPWCMAAHGVGLLFALAAAALAPLGGASRDGGGLSGAAGLSAMLLGFVGMGAVAGGQFLWPAATHQMHWASGVDFDRGHGPSREVSFFGGRVRVRPGELPMLGSPDAPYLIAYVYDYTCFHCRTTARQITQAFEVYGEKLGVLMLCAPNDASCNPMLLQTPAYHEGACELAAVAAAVWRADAARFAAFHAWLFEPETPPTPAEARLQAAELVGQEALAAALASDFPAEHIKRGLAFQRMSSRITLPMIAARNAVLHGRPASERVLIEFIADTFGVARPLTDP